MADFEAKTRSQGCGDKVARSLDVIIISFWYNSLSVFKRLRFNTSNFGYFNGFNC